MQPMATLEAMAALGVPLLMHGEVTDPAVDVFDREAVFIERVLEPLMKRLPRPEGGVRAHHHAPGGRVCRRRRPPTWARTITPHHLLFNRNEMFKGGIRPHFYCLPVLKREEHRVALVKAATSGSAKFFLGTDSAPHATNTARRSPAAARAATPRRMRGWNSMPRPSTLPGALDKLEAFASFHGPDFYGLPAQQRHRLRSSARPGRWPSACPISTIPASCPCGPGRRWPGSWRR
jgi:dihydroorotase